MKSHFLFPTALAALALFATACGSSGAGSPDDEVDQGALGAAASNLVGPYFANDGSDTYATELHLESDGTFKGTLNRPFLGAGMCTVAPCVVDAEGRFSARDDRLTLRVQKLGGRSGNKTLNLKYRLERGVVPMLIIEDATSERGEQRLMGRGTNPGRACIATMCTTGSRCIERSDGTPMCVPDGDPPTGCARVRCASGRRCVEADGQARCVLDTSASCAGKQCGDECVLCMDRLDCFETAVLKKCGADGQCSPREPVCN